MTRRHRPHPGRRPGIRPGRLSRARRADPRRQGRRGVRLAVRLGVAAQDPAVLARRRQPLPDLADEHPQRHQPDRHGDLLQGRQGRHPQADAALQRPLRHRAGADDEAGAVEHPALRGARSAITAARVAEGKKIGWKDAVSAVWTLLKYRFIDDRFTTHDGYYVLQSMRRARGLNRWILEQFRAVHRQPRARGRLRHRQLHRAAARSRAAGLRRQRSALRRDGELAPRASRERAHAEARSVGQPRPTAISSRSASTPSSASTSSSTSRPTSRCCARYYDLLRARRPRDHPGARAHVALRPVRRGARPRAPLHADRAAHQDAGGRLRGRR